MEILLLIAVIVVGVGYALMPQILSLGLDDREPAPETKQVQKLREEKEKWIQGIVDLDTERDVGNMDEDEYQRLRTKYQQRATSVLRKLKQLDATDDVSDDDEDLDARVEASIQRKKDEISTSSD